MKIDFPLERWEETKSNYDKWWQGELGRPLIALSVGGKNPVGPEPEVPARNFHSHYDESIPLEKIFDRHEFELSKLEFTGDSFPAFFPNFGPGVIAAFLGCELHNGENTVWFHPAEIKPITQLQFNLDKIKDNPWFKRVEHFTAAAAERWQGQVQIGMTDLGGNLDIISSFRSAEYLLLDLYDYPEEVKRLTWQAHRAWWHCFELLNRAGGRWNPGYSAWTPIFSSKPYYILQCDFCYMISPDMFDEFVKPELTESCRRLDNAFYHLDGPGQLSHLDSLLSIPELKGVQWVPGAGQDKAEHWPEVYGKIKEAGKKIQLFTGQCEDWTTILDTLYKQIGSLDNLILTGKIGIDKKDKLLEMLKKYGVQ